MKSKPLSSLPSLGESGSGGGGGDENDDGSGGDREGGTRVRFNYLYFVIMRRVKRGFFLSRKKKDGVRSRIYIFMNNSFDEKKKKKKSGKRGKKRCLYAKGSPQNAQLL